ncbi:nicotinate (nicotinamide) nucleotide adenylyltransferase [Blattabacterium cuenoti]|uniref:nicotinate (nicotinamide) nucleotide adenylyltransferase n=1 Tax=Blattabacterium cuenoti TaxID=1653831 RepID=UPI00163B681F|nr:nicotinate (nicotinamide) nucleotide adenylyltransferase [Blattabacterium cuenoti]
MKIVLYFGSFNPIHLGHIIIANYITEFIKDVDHVWFIVSPQNPFKKKCDLLDYENRIKMVRIAIYGYEKMNILDIESGYSPSYTIYTLCNIEKKFPNNKFSILLGKDSFSSLKKWKNYNLILNRYDILVYPRIGFFYNPIFKQGKIIFLKAPIIDISSSSIRNSIKKGKNIKPLLHTEVWNYINKYKFYR